MSKPSTIVPFEIASDDLADLEEWARNSETSVAELLQEALQQYLRYTRDDIADLRRRMQGPSYALEEVKAHLAERRLRFRGEAAE
jgi:dsDNA-binding SOS-regulon protein